jgi:alpha-amylase
MTDVDQVFGEKGVGSSGGSFFNSTSHAESFPAANYSPEHFNDYRCDVMVTNDDYAHNAERVHNCRLVHLVDLNLGIPHVRDMMMEWLNRMIGYGVAGFRVDAAKHMWPADLDAIFSRLTPLKKEVTLKLLMIF